MRDRTLGIIFTLIIVFVIGVPGLACMCLGLSSFLLYPFMTQTNISPAWTNTAGAVGLCIGFFLVLITVVISYLLLHQRQEKPAIVTVQPTPPPPVEKSPPPSNPDEPLPPTI